MLTMNNAHFILPKTGFFSGKPENLLDIFNEKLHA